MSGAPWNDGRRLFSTKECASPSRETEKKAYFSHPLGEGSENALLAFCGLEINQY
jgi:hypothetical protein